MRREGRWPPRRGRREACGRRVVRVPRTGPPERTRGPRRADCGAKASRWRSSLSFAARFLHMIRAGTRVKRNLRRTASLLPRTMFVAAILFPSAGALSQEHTGSISGHTRDASGAVVPGVVVSARHLQTGFRQSAISDASGVYRISGLPAGVYDVTAEISGFTTGLVT